MRAATRRGSFKGKIIQSTIQQRNKAASYGHLMLPRSIPLFKEKPGSVVQLDILPYVVTDERHPDRDDETERARKGDMWYRRPYKLHRNIGAENNSAVCPTSVGKKCPICEYRAKLLSDGTSWEDETVKALRAGQRNLYYIIPKKDKELDEIPHLWDIANSLFQKALEDEYMMKEEYESFPSLEGGYTLTVRFSEEKFKTSVYAKTSRIDFDKRGPYDEAMIDQLPSLDDVLVVKGYKELEREFFETGDADGEGEAEGDAETAAEDTPRPTTRPVTRTAPVAASPKLVPSFTRGKPVEQPPAEEGAERVDPPVRPAASAAAASRSRVAAAPAAKERCPHGHRFGVECDQHSECEECTEWGACMDAMEAAA